MRVHFALGNRRETGGWAAYARALEAAFAKSGVSVTNTAYEPWMFRLPSGVRHLVYFFRLMPGVIRADAVIAFDTWSAGLPAVLAARLMHTPLLVRVGGDFLWEQYVERTGELVTLSTFYARERAMTQKERFIYAGTQYLLLHASVVAFNSSWQRDLWQQAYRIGANVRVIENAFPERISGHPPNRRTFIAAGRPIRLKNEALLREAFDDVRREHPDIELDTSSLPPTEHQERIAGCYAVVLASVSDVAPNAVIDAVKYGKPFIAPRDTGIRERLEGTGLFVNTLDKAELTRALRTLLDREEYERIAGRVRAYAFVRSWEEVAREFRQALEGVVPR